MANYSFATGNTTILQPAVDMLEGQMATHAAWSKVDTIINGTMTCTVWRCAGTANSFKQDFYVYIARSTSNPTSISMTASEGYDSTGKNAVRPVVGTIYSTAAPAADFSYGGGTGYPIFSAASTLNTSAQLWFVTTSLSSSYTWTAWANVTSNGVFFWGQGSTSSGWNGYVGLFDSFLPADPFPLTVATNLYSSNLTTGVGWSRHPTITAANTNNWRAQGPSAQPWTVTTGIMGGVMDRFWNTRPVAAKAAMRVALAGGAAMYGDLRGLWKDLVVFNVASASVTNADTIVIGSDQYAYSANVSASANYQGCWVCITAP